MFRRNCSTDQVRLFTRLPQKVPIELLASGRCTLLLCVASYATLARHQSLTAQVMKLSPGPGHFATGPVAMSGSAPVRISTKPRKERIHASGFGAKERDHRGEQD